MEETAQLSARIEMPPFRRAVHESISNSVAVAKMRTVQKKRQHRAATKTVSARQMFIESLLYPVTPIFSQSERKVNAPRRRRPR